jgi:hypothetical protein
MEKVRETLASALALFSKYSDSKQIKADKVVGIYRINAKDDK